MTTDAQKGNSFLLQIADKYDGTDYTTVAAMRTTSITIAKTSVDITSKDSGGWQELLPGGGVKSVSISAEGVYADHVTQNNLLNAIVGKIAATGTVTFGVNPSNDDEFIFNGVTWTFKTSGATGSETNIKGSLELTLDQLTIDMNASAEANLIVATYSNDTTDAIVTYDTIGTDGNAYTLADGSQGGANSTPSGATLNGGMNQNKNWNMKLITEPGHFWTGSFQVESYDMSGDSDAEHTFSVTLNSGDEVTYTTV